MIGIAQHHEHRRPIPVRTLAHKPLLASGCEGPGWQRIRTSLVATYTADVSINSWTYMCGRRRVQTRLRRPCYRTIGENIVNSYPVVEWLLIVRK